MRSTHTVLTTVAVLIVTAATLSADRIRLRSGKIIELTFMSADSKIVRGLLANGSIVSFPVDDVAAVEFTPRKAPPPPPPDPVRRPPPVTIPAGTTLSVRLTQTIDVDTSATGQTFKALLDDPVMIGGNVIIPRGAAVVLQAAHVEQAGTTKGADKVSLKANSIAFGGRTYEIVTGYIEKSGEGEGKKTARKVGGGAGLGAIVGGIAGGGQGAAIGAAVGAAAGGIMATQGTEHLKLPAETRLQLILSAAFNVQP